MRGFLEGSAFDTRKRIVPHGLWSELIVAPALGFSSSGAAPPTDSRRGQVVATQVGSPASVTLDNVSPHQLLLVEHGAARQREVAAAAARCNFLGRRTFDRIPSSPHLKFSMFAVNPEL